MRIFRRKPEPEPARATLDGETLDRLLRAGVPIPFEWFMVQPPEVQETIAAHADRYREDVLLAQALFIQDPEGMRLALALEDGDQDAEGELAKRAAEAIAAHLGGRGHSGAAGGAQAPTRPTMAGLGKRRQEAAQRAADAAKPAPSPFGGKRRGATG